MELNRERGRASLVKLGALEILAQLQSRPAPKRVLTRPEVSLESMRLVRDARNFAVQNYGEHYAISEIARRFGMSTTVFKTTFREVYGDSHAHYMRGIRMERAEAALSEGSSVADAAREVGYRSASKFSAAFQKHYGETPSAYHNNRLQKLPICRFPSEIGKS